MLPTPDLSHLHEQDYELIYEPAEDSYILLDALEADKDTLDLLPACPVVAEIGPGTGIASSFVQAQMLGPQGRSCLSFAIDINIHACNATRETCRRNLELFPAAEDALQLTEVIRGSLLDCLRLPQQVDLLLFNPPYVPTARAEINVDGTSLAATWAGGADGMAVTQQLLPLLPQILSAKGVFYLVAVARNKPAELIKDAPSSGCEARIILERKAGREKLCVIRFRRTS
jgi:release factor glutamine methyltransferase